MIKRSLKYFLIAGINVMLLTMLLFLWVDELVFAFKNLILLVEFLKIIGITLLALLGMAILADILNRRKPDIPKKRKIIYSGALTVMVSSYFYFTYSVKTANVLFNPNRKSLVEKLSYPEHILNGIKGDNLTYKEYSELRKISGFVELPASAFNISFEFDYDGFLPDYRMEIKYYVPLDEKIENINYKKDDFSKHQSFETRSGEKYVTYREVLM